MKKIIYLGVVLFAFGFVSCKKCQTCTTTTEQDVLGSVISSSVSEEYCGDEYDNAPAEASVTQNVAGVNQTVSITCVDD